MDDLSKSEPQPTSTAHFSQPGTSADVQFAQPYAAAASLQRFQAPAVAGPGPVRRRRFSAAKIQPTRIKKVMQSDEEIGRMVASVPVAIGRAMEHFAEKFLQAAAQMTIQSNSRTLTPAHMKQAMLKNPHFRFLEPVLGDIGIPRPIEFDMSAADPSLWNPSASPASSPVCSPMDIQQLQSMANVVLSPAALATQLRSPTTGIRVPFPIHTSITTEEMKLLLAASGALLPSENVAQTTSDVSADAKQAVAETEEVEKPKRGRPRKVKKEYKCVDDDLLKDVTSGIEKEDKDREMMPPPALPMGSLPRSRAKQVA